MGDGLESSCVGRVCGADVAVRRASRPHFTSGKDPVPILQEAVMGTGPV